MIERGIHIPSFCYWLILVDNDQKGQYSANEVHHCGPTKMPQVTNTHTKRLIIQMFHEDVKDSMAIGVQGWLQQKVLDIDVQGFRLKYKRLLFYKCLLLLVRLAYTLYTVYEIPYCCSGI